MSYRIRPSEDATDFTLFESLKGNASQLDAGYFIAESPKIVGAVLESALTVRAGLMTEQHFARFEKQLESRPELIEITIVTKAVMEQIVGYPLHQGVMLAVAIPESPSLEHLLIQNSRPHTFVALDRIADAENMGTIIRTCAAFGVTALIVDDQSCHPFLRRSVRVSMGTVVDFPIVFVKDLRMSLEYLRGMAVTVIGATQSERSEPLTGSSLGGNIVIVLGAEGHGLGTEIVAACDRLIEIPISKNVDSLNVGVACGIILFERMRSIAA